MRGGHLGRWLASDKSSRIPIAAFQRAMALQGVESEAAEVECMVANMIYKVGWLGSGTDVCVGH